MSGVETLLACVIALVIAYVAAWAICCGAVPIIWDHLKAFYRWPSDVADRVVRREVSAVLEPREIPVDPWREIQPWSPAERSALGIDDNEKWIRETDQILNGLEWERFTAEIDDPALQRAIRRNGAQL